MCHNCTLACSALAGTLFTCLAVGQDIEPRRWTPLPVAMNILGAGIGNSDGDINVDPVLGLEDVTVDAETVVVSQMRRNFDRLLRLQPAPAPPSCSAFRHLVNSGYVHRPAPIQAVVAR